MIDWDRIIELYQTATRRVGTPYEAFGKGMLSLVEKIRATPSLAGVRPGTSMWTLTLDTFVHVYRDDDGKFMVFLRRPNTDENIVESQVSDDDVIEAIKKQLDHYRKLKD
jgi:hypothetical protein